MKHETKNTIEMVRRCDNCGKNTRHSVSGKRPGHCLEHGVGDEYGLSVRQVKERERREKEAREPKLF